MDFRKQHFSIESKFDGKMPKMIKHDDLEIGFNSPACASYELTHKLIKKSVVALCFDADHNQSCFYYDGRTGKITKFPDSTYPHWFGGLANYKEGLITAGGYWNQIGERLQLNRDHEFEEFNPNNYFWTFTVGIRELTCSEP